MNEEGNTDAVGTLGLIAESSNISEKPKVLAGLDGTTENQKSEGMLEANNTFKKYLEVVYTSMKGLEVEITSTPNTKKKLRAWCPWSATIGKSSLNGIGSQKE